MVLSVFLFPADQLLNIYQQLLCVNKIPESLASLLELAQFSIKLGRLSDKVNGVVYPRTNGGLLGMLPTVTQR